MKSEVHYKNNDDLEFWSGLGKGVDLSLAVLNDELKDADEVLSPSSQGR